MHIAVSAFKPLDVTLTRDFWAELQSEWEAAFGFAVVDSISGEIVVDGCDECEDGDCPCCGGGGSLDCHSMGCHVDHSCEVCRGNGKCHTCGGTGTKDGVRRRPTKPGEKKHVPEQTEQWLSNRPSVKKAA